MIDLSDPWPFRGRHEELGQAEAGLRSSRSLALVGPTGVGKSRAAREIASALGNDFHVIAAPATAAAATVPFGAFAHLLPPLAVGREPDRLSLFRLISSHLTDLAEGRPVMLLVDDAQNLDPPSAALVLHLVRSTPTTVVVTVRSGEATPDAISALWKDGFAERIDLGPLARPDVERVVLDALGHPLSPSAAEAIWKLTEGNPLFVREVVRALVDHGRLTVVDGALEWDGELPIGARLAELITDRIERLDTDHRTALEMVALTEPIGAHLLGQLTVDDAVVVLERSGLVQVGSSRRRAEVYLAHPLHGEVLRSLIPTSAARAHRRAVADATERTGARRREDLLRIAVWRLDADGHGDPELLTDAAFRATRTADPALGERLASAAMEAGAHPRAALALAEARNLLRRSAAAEEVLAQWWEELVAADAATARSAALQRVLALHFGADRSAEVDRHLEALTDRYPEPWNQQIRGLRSLVLTAIDVDEAQRIASPLVEDPTADRWARHFAINAVVTHHAFAGATDRALAALVPLLGEALDLVEEFPYAPAWILTLHARILGNAGRFDDIEMLVGSLLQVATSTGDDQSLGGAYMGLGHRAYYGGDLRRSASMLSAALGHLELSDLAGLRPWTLAVRTMALAALGEVAATASVYAELAAMLPHVAPHPFSAAEVAGAQAWATASAGDAPRARSLALDAARRSQLRMHRAMLAVIAHRLGADDEEVADILIPATEGAESPLMLAYHAHASALRAGRPPADLEAVAASYVSMGMAVHAAETWVEACEAHRREGNATAARRCGGQARALLDGPAAGARTPIIGRLDTPGLTERERQVATVAARGRTNAEIAALLSISVRTVEWHLGQAYTKLGVRRHELADIFGSTSTEA